MGGEIEVQGSSSRALVGRSEPLGRLRETIAEVRRGSLRCLLVEGEAGIGKTALARNALADEAAVVVWASGDEAEAELDLGVVDQLVRAAPFDAGTRRAVSEQIAGDPLRAGEALVRVVDGLTIDPDHPLIVVVDDAQWVDQASLRALTFAARRLRRDPVLLCVLVRSVDDAGLPDSLVRLVDELGTRVRLAPLQRDEVRELAQTCTGRPVSVEAADRLLSHTSGNPLHLRTLLDELGADALIGTGELPAPRSFATLVLSRLAACPPAVESLVTAVAVLGERAELTTAAALAAVDDAVAALDDAVAAGLLVVVDDGFESGRISIAAPHPLVRAAVLGDLSTGRRADLHRRAGALVPAVAGLRHRLLGTRTPDGDLWADALQTCAAEADRGAHGSAAALLQLAAGVAPSAGDAERALLEATDQLLLAGRSPDAADRRGAVEAAPPSPRRSYLLARLAYILGPRAEARAHLLEAWASLTCGGGAPDAELAGRVAAMLATVSVDRAAGGDAIDWSRRALAASPKDAARLSVAHMLASGHALSGSIATGLVELDQLCGSLDRTAGANAPMVADAHSARGVLRLWAHDLEGAAVDLEASLEAASGGGSFDARESARFYLGEVRYRQGRWDDALLQAQLAASIAEDADQLWMAALPHATAARPLAARGSTAADEHLDRARHAAAASGSPVGATLVHLAAMEVAICRRDMQQAAELGDAVESFSEHLEERFVPWRAGYVEALVSLGRVDDGERFADQLARSSPTPVARSDAALAALLVAGARGDEQAFDRAATWGLAIDADAIGPYPRARLELAAGRGWRRRGERRRAITVLEAAHARFEALGADPWLEQVGREIAAAGLRPQRRRPGGSDTLTAREQAVAQLVARGMTNTEVATELIVSAKTVEHHLSRIYAKLGIRSRTELAAVLLSGG